MTEPAPLPLATPPGWYPEPATRRYRWWDGIQWAFYAEGAQVAPAPSAAFAPRRSPANGMATASLVLGIVGIVTCTLAFPSGLAVAFGIVGLRRANQRGGAGRGKAIWGLALGGTVLLVLAVVFLLAANLGS